MNYAKQKINKVNWHIITIKLLKILKRAYENKTISNTMNDIDESKPYYQPDKIESIINYIKTHN